MIVKIGKKDVDLVANAATPVIYERVFKQDLLKQIQGLENGENIALVKQCAFIMAEQAKTGNIVDLSKIGDAQYLDFLCGFGAIDFENSVEEIMGVFTGDAENADAESKKNSEPQPES